ATDNSGNIIVVGYTGNSLPYTASAYQTFYGGGGFDAFITKFDSGGIPLWATYFGGNDTDYGYSIATDHSDNIVITGSTASSIFPISMGAFQSKLSDYSGDGFIAKFNPNGSRLWSTYYGG